MAEGDNKPPVLIRKRRKAHAGHAHHGGAWKVAYADFVTAMMAFFLLLWLLSTATEEQKKSIADYFSPVSVARNTQSGSGGILGGQTITADGAMVSDRTPFAVTVTLPASDFQPSETTEEPSEGEEMPAAEEYAEAEERAVDDLGDGEEPDIGRGERPGHGREDGKLDDLSEQELARLTERQAEAEFETAVEQLRRAVQSVPELAELADNLLLDRTSEGMRLQIVDQQGTSMFERGSAVPGEKTRKLFSMISRTLATLPNRIAIKGHTDAVPYRGDGDYTNWELSSDRALASRRALIRAGLDPARVADVVGKADTDPLVAGDPEAPQNRRISIILLNQPAVAAAPGEPTQDASGGPAPGRAAPDDPPGTDPAPAAQPAAAPRMPATAPAVDAGQPAASLPAGDGVEPERDRGKAGLRAAAGADLAERPAARR